MRCPKCNTFLPSDRDPNTLTRYYKCSCGHEFQTIEVELDLYRKQVFYATTGKVLKEKYGA